MEQNLIPPTLIATFHVVSYQGVNRMEVFPRKNTNLYSVDDSAWTDKHNNDVRNSVFARQPCTRGSFPSINLMVYEYGIINTGAVSSV